MPGATVDATCASTASPIDEVTANRSPKVATAHSMITSAGASSSSAPACRTSSCSSASLRPSVLVPLNARAAVVLAVVIAAPRCPERWAGRSRRASSGRRPAGRRGTPTRHGPPRWGGGSRRRSRGSGRGSPATTRRRSSDCLELAVADLAAQRGVLGTGDPFGEGLLVAALLEESADHVGHVVVQTRAGDLVRAQLHQLG